MPDVTRSWKSWKVSAPGQPSQCSPEWTLGALDEVAIGFFRAEPLDRDADLRESIDRHRFEPGRIRRGERRSRGRVGGG